MDVKNVQAYFDSDGVVDDYAKAAVELGLWASEERILTRFVLARGFSAGVGLWSGAYCDPGSVNLGYRNLLATDYARNMVGKTRYLAKRLDYAIHSRVADATCLEFEDEIFDGRFSDSTG